MEEFLKKLYDNHPLTRAKRMLTNNPITSNYVESVLQNDAQITLDEFSPQAQMLLTEIVDAETKKGNKSIGKSDILQHIQGAWSGPDITRALTNPTPFDEIWLTLNKFDVRAAPQHNSWILEDTYDTSPGYQHPALRGLSWIDRTAQKYLHGDEPRRGFSMNIPMLSGNRTRNP